MVMIPVRRDNKWVVGELREKKSVVLLDLIVKASSKYAFARMFNANQANDIAQAVVCRGKQQDHDVEFLGYTGS